MPHLPVPNGSLFYADDGDGVPLVMIHAGIADHTMWQPQVDAFKQRCRCIRFDQRGWGQSVTEAGKPYNRVDDVKALLDHLGVERAVMIGCSIGGSAALNVAVFAPERALALVAVAAGINGFPEDGSEFPELPLFEQIEAHENAGEFAEAAAMEAKIWGVGPRRPLEQGNRAVYDYIYRIDYDHYINPREKGDSQPSPSAYEHLAQLSLPALIICGEEDETPTMAMSRYMGATIPNAQLHMMPNAAHLPNREHPDEFNRILGAFLASL